MASNTRTKAQIRAEIKRLTALLSDSDKASTTTRKAPAKRKARKTTTKAVAPRKGDQAFKGAGGTLTRSDWNKTLTTLAKTRTGKGSGAYKAVIEAWSVEVTEYRNTGLTPVEVIEALGFTVTV